MKYLLLSVLSLILAYFPLSAQTNLDSLWAVWNDSGQADTNRLEAISVFTKKGFLGSNPDSAYQLANMQRAYAQQQNLPNYEAFALHTQGNALFNLSRHDEAIEHFQQAIKIWEEVKDQDGLTYSLNRIGRIYFTQGNFENAITHYEAQLEIEKAIGDVRGQLGAFGSLANIYSHQGNLIKGMEYYSQSLVMAEKLENKKFISANKINIAGIYLELNDYDKAELFYEEGIALAREINHFVFLANGIEGLGSMLLEKEAYAKSLNLHQEAYAIRLQTGYTYGQGYSLHNIGMAFKYLGEKDSAQKYFQQSLDLRQEINDQAGVLESLNGLGILYAEQGKSLAAIKASGEALQIAQETGVLFQNFQANHTLATAHRQIGNYAKSNAYLLKAFELRDSLINERIEKAVFRQEYQYEYEKQAFTDSLAFVQQQAATELSYQQQLSRRNYLLFGGLGLALLAFLFLRYRQQLRNREQELALQQERERKEQLAELNGLKSRFFANISHEFRTPLTLVLGRNQMMQAKLDDPALDSQFDEVDRNGRRLLELVNQVLDLSKLEAGNIHLQAETIDLVPFLKNMLFSFESLADQKAQKLQFESEHDALLMVADPEKLERVFFNLLSNAIKFTPRQGTISLQLQVIANRAHIRVTDNGNGISEAELPFIFDRFYQSSSNREQSSPGTGIGLALAKELVELHQGSLNVESRLGEGSTFWAELPLDDVAKEVAVSDYQPQLEPLEKISSESSTMPPLSDKQKQAKVLVVEDNPDVRSYLKDELHELGYEVLEAENGKEGLLQAKKGQPELIISDVMMPRMDGFEFAEAIRKDVQSSHIPIILLTAKASQDSKLTGLRIGADAYLTKPFNREELKVRVAKLIEQREHLRQRFSKVMQIKPEEVSAVPMDQAFLQKLTAYIEENISNDQFGVEPLAEHMGMSSVYLNRKLNALIGQSAGKLIRSMRLQRAADLIKQQAGTISEIAFDLGFSSPTNFARSFKQQFGVTPKAWGKRV